MPAHELAKLAPPATAQTPVEPLWACNADALAVFIGLPRLWSLGVAVALDWRGWEATMRELGLHPRRHAERELRALVRVAEAAWAEHRRAQQEAQPEAAA